MSQSRRELLVNAGRLVVLLPLGWAAAGAAGCADDAGDCDAAGKAERNGDQLVYTSSCDGDHTHRFTLQAGDLTAPPAAGVGGATSSDDGHTHTVALSAADLGQIEGGGSVTRTSSASGGHTHSFTFTKV